MMDKKNIFVVVGRSGIGLEIVKKLENQQNEVFVGSRTRESLQDHPQVQHLKLDVTQDFSDLAGLPEIVHGLVYCPGSIVLKPFQRLTSADFRNDLEINLQIHRWPLPCCPVRTAKKHLPNGIPSSGSACRRKSPL